MSEPYILIYAKDGEIAKTVAPLVRNSLGKYECVVAVVYNAEGLPISLWVSKETKEVPAAEWEPLQNL